MRVEFIDGERVSLVNPTDELGPDIQRVDGKWTATLRTKCKIMAMGLIGCNGSSRIPDSPL